MRRCSSRVSMLLLRRLGLNWTMTAEEAHRWSPTDCGESLRPLQRGVYTSRLLVHEEGARARQTASLQMLDALDGRSGVVAHRSFGDYPTTTARWTGQGMPLRFLSILYCKRCSIIWAAACVALIRKPSFPPLHQIVDLGPRCGLRPRFSRALSLKTQLIT
jgi:hypothetical protein